MKLTWKEFQLAGPRPPVRPPFQAACTVKISDAFPTDRGSLEWGSRAVVGYQNILIADFRGRRFIEAAKKLW